MQASFQFLGAGTPDGGAKSILLTIDGHRYMFNCSPGTQRCALQHCIKLSKVEAVFFTDLSWNSIGGFKGLASTLADLETPIGHQIKVIGPKGLQTLIDASQPFLKRSIPFLKIIEFEDNFTFQDDLIKVTSVTFEDQFIGYLVEGPRVLGTFDATRAKILGLKPGPAYKLLLDGQSVSLEDGRMINPDDVVSLSRQFPKILLVERDVVENIEFDIKICYQQSLPANDSTFFVPSLSWEPVLVDALELESQLFNVSPQFHSQLYSQAESFAVKPLDEQILFPKSYLNRSHLYPSSNKENNNLLNVIEEVVVTLGTGAAMPGKYRNVSATLLNRHDIKGIFDCGEATLGQLMRKYGPQYLDLINHLDFIAISHLHSDHHLGLLSLLEAKTSTKTLCIFVPNGIYYFIRVYQQVVNIEFQNVTFIPLENVESTYPLNESFTLEKIPVDHCEGACAFLLHNADEKLFMYSGDTRPCPTLIEQGKNVQILVHEATMPDDLQGEAIVRKHCTIHEAIDVASQVNPKLTILTHFSQRFGKELPPSYANVIMASDFMHVLLKEKVIRPDDNRHALLNAL